MTKYKVFAQVNGHFSPIGPDIIEARSSISAINRALHGRNDVDGYDAFVAIPARSFQPVTVTAETKTTLKFNATAREKVGSAQ